MFPLIFWTQAEERSPEITARIGRSVGRSLGRSVEIWHTRHVLRLTPATATRPPRYKNSQDSWPRSLARPRAPAQCTRGNRWLMAAPGSHTFFHKPPVNPNLATLLHCTQISAINFPHCAVARLSAANLPSPSSTPPPLPPASVTSFCLSLFHHALVSLSSTAFLRPRPRSIPHRHIPSPSSQSLPDRGPHCHWQTDLNGGIKSIRSNGTRYIRPNENSAPEEEVDRGTISARLESTRSAEREDFCLRKSNWTLHYVKRSFFEDRGANWKYLATTWP